MTARRVLLVLASLLLAVAAGSGLLADAMCGIAPGQSCSTDTQCECRYEVRA